MNKSKNKTVQFGKVLTGDFQEKTLTFEMKEGFYIQGGEFAMVRKDDFNKMVQSLEECTTFLERIDTQESYRAFNPARIILEKIKN